MAIRERIEDVTGEPPSWWALELYKVAFLLIGGLYVGWQIGIQCAAAPPAWLAWTLFPGMFYMIWVFFPWPGKGPGLSM
jgi:hypothetical protein